MHRVALILATLTGLSPEVWREALAPGRRLVWYNGGPAIEVIPGVMLITGAPVVPSLADPARCWEALADRGVIPADAVGDPARAFVVDGRCPEWLCAGTGLIHDESTGCRHYDMGACAMRCPACDRCWGTGCALAPYPPTLAAVIGAALAWSDLVAVEASLPNVARFAWHVEAWTAAEVLHLVIADRATLACRWLAADDDARRVTAAFTRCGPAAELLLARRAAKIGGDGE